MTGPGTNKANQKFSAKFDKPMEPSTARSILQNLTQESSEDLETFAERLFLE